jgi:hypothetical protein
MEMNLMGFETYGLPDNEYYKLLSSKSQFVLNCLAVMTTEASNKGINLQGFSDKFLWDLFIECVYSADEQARLIQKEKNPDEIKARSWDPGPSRDELLEEIRSVNAKTEALADYIAELITKFFPKATD